MTTYKTPGVYIQEINSLPPSVAAVSTAIPAFIGKTRNILHPATGVDLVAVPQRISSLLDFTTIYGIPDEKIEVSVEFDTLDGSKITDIRLTLTTIPSIETATKPSSLLYYQLQMYFANGGGPCYVLSIGGLATAVTSALYDSALTILKTFDEPTLIVCTDACLAGDGVVAAVANLTLAHCQEMKDRFSILDVPRAYKSGNDTAALLDVAFRTPVGTTPEQSMYGAAYYPFLKSNLNYAYNGSVATGTAKVILLKKFQFVTNASGAVVPHTTTPIDIIIANAAAGKTFEDDVIKKSNNAIYNAILTAVNNFYVVLPPSAAIAGVYATTDRNRGVWKAPANVGLAMVSGPMIKITQDFNDELNSPTTGKAINVIRNFTGKGTMVWGGRTLNANDLNWRFVNVRREVIFIEESVQKALESFIFEPNTANTWVRAKAMVENFLSLIWRQGGLAGAKPEDAFDVQIGLGTTMDAMDVAAGVMIMAITLVPPRPAEVIVLRVSQKLQVS